MARAIRIMLLAAVSIAGCRAIPPANTCDRCFTGGVTVSLEVVEERGVDRNDQAVKELVAAGCDPKTMKFVVRRCPRCGNRSESIDLPVGSN